MRVLNSSCSVLIILIENIAFLFGMGQNTGVNIIRKIKELNQFHDILKVAVGSNLENKLVIMFN